VENELSELYDLALSLCDNKIERATTLIEACATVAMASDKRTLQVMREYAARLDGWRALAYRTAAVGISASMAKQSPSDPEPQPVEPQPQPVQPQPQPDASKGDQLNDAAQAELRRREQQAKQ